MVRAEKRQEVAVILLIDSENGDAGRFVPIKEKSSFRKLFPSLKASFLE
jgi:hypothetical protein